MQNINETHAHARDVNLTFDPIEHTYSLNGEQLTSVTTLVDDAFPKFDAVYWSMRKAYNDEAKAAEIRRQWEDNARIARDLGTNMHEHIEDFYLHQSDPDDPTICLNADSTFCHFLEFARNNRLTPYRTEWRIYHEDFKIAGTLDFLAFNGEKFEIYDWKRSNKLINKNTGEEIRENTYGKTALEPLGNLPDTTYHHYALQVSIYRYILEQKYGIQVSDGYLGVFHPDYSRHYNIRLPYLRDEVLTLLSHHLQQHK